MLNSKKTIESLIKGGLIGSFIGAFLLKDKEEGAIIGAIIGAVTAATLKANSDAQNTNLPVYIEENGSIYAISAKGKKEFIKQVPKPAVQYPEHFKLS
jgi:gas vesicle protein